jgi:hypothetical protein
LYAFALAPAVATAADPDDSASSPLGDRSSLDAFQELDLDLDSSPRARAESDSAQRPWAR